MAANFNNSVKGALQGLLDAMTQTKDAVSDHVAGLSIQAASDMMADPKHQLKNRTRRRACR